MRSWPSPRSRRPGLTPARSTLSDFGRRLQMGRLTPAQEVRVLAHLDTVERTYPEHAALVSGPRSVVRSLMVGKTAPEITGKDLDGKPFRLSDYRGKVVVLAFWAEWCGICRTSYPYERLLEELYKNWPFAIVGVNSDENRDVARRAIAQQQLTYRSWWDGDGGSGDPTAGPIADGLECDRLARGLRDRRPRRDPLHRPRARRPAQGRPTTADRGAGPLEHHCLPAGEVRGRRDAPTPLRHRCIVPFAVFAYCAAEHRSAIIVRLFALSLGRSFSGTIWPAGAMGAIFTSGAPLIVTSWLSSFTKSRSSVALARM